MGILAWMRAVHVDQAIGLMTTASHNLVEDNGVKMIDPGVYIDVLRPMGIFFSVTLISCSDGGMLEPAWEVHAAELANKSTPEEVLEFLKALAKKLKIRTREADGEFEVLADSGT